MKCVTPCGCDRLGVPAHGVNCCCAWDCPPSGVCRMTLPGLEDGGGISPELPAGALDGGPDSAPPLLGWPGGIERFPSLGDGPNAPELLCTGVVWPLAAEEYIVSGECCQFGPGMYPTPGTIAAPRLVRCWPYADWKYGPYLSDGREADGRGGMTDLPIGGRRSGVIA